MRWSCHGDNKILENSDLPSKIEIKKQLLVEDIKPNVFQMGTHRERHRRCLPPREIKLRYLSTVEFQQNYASINLCHVPILWRLLRSFIIQSTLLCRQIMVVPFFSEIDRLPCSKSLFRAVLCKLAVFCRFW